MPSSGQPSMLESLVWHTARRVAENITIFALDGEDTAYDLGHSGAAALEEDGIAVHAADSYSSAGAHNGADGVDGDHYDETYHDGLLSDADHGGGHSQFGVHVIYEDLYHSLVFLICIYVSGVVSARILRMPNLVGEIVCGIILGPPLLDFVPNAEAFVLLGELGLILLVLEAGIDIDVSMLKLIGTRGFLIAVIGSVLPIGLGMFVAFLIGVDDVKAIISAGAVFGPTSLGIALNILRGGGILNTPVGQLIISAAVIDDMVALIVLSQLESLVGTITVAGVLIPVISAMLYLCVGGYVAIWVLPPFLEKYVLNHINASYKGKFEMTIMFGLLLALMPATYYSKASYLMGAFVAGLAFCTSHELHSVFVRQFKRLLQWLMRIFFAASIGFQVPVKDFSDPTVIWQGLVFTLALLGKLAVGFLVPNFTRSRSFTNLHLRDCLITGFSMAAEGEFAFVIAVFGVDNGLISKDLYASVVLAVLLSTIIPPFLLRFTINYYNKKAEETVQQVVENEMKRKHDLESTIEAPDREEVLEEGIRNRTAVFLCIQTQSESSWGLMHRLMAKLGKLGLEIIDHRAWSPRGVKTTLVNEIYAKDTIQISKGASKEILEARIKEINEALMKTIDQPLTSKVKVQRWYPGVVEEYTESVDENQSVRTNKALNLEQRLLEAATAELERKQALQTAATHEKTVEEILKEMGKEVIVNDEPSSNAAALANVGDAPARRPKRRRQKMRSTPVVGGGLFGEGGTDKEEVKHEPGAMGITTPKGACAKDLLNFHQPGHAAEIIVQGESYKIRISDETLKNLRKGYSGEMMDSRGIYVNGGMSIQHDESNVVGRLKGYIRNVAPLGMISEEGDGHSETSDQKTSQAGTPSEEAC